MDKETIIKELKFKAIRSSGAGGQHVNKVSSKVELSFDVKSSLGLSSREKERLILKLSNRLNKQQLLLLQCDEARSQHKNRQLVIHRFFDVLKKALHVPKKRKPTKPSKSSIEKRLTSKKRAATIKSFRKKPNLD
ncbi:MULTISPECIES: alternative ribosome rescue aminoacyl-tRNA hydrolase ArfB [Croceitalea]|uniref:Alternative ribosome rescue aminoacyl-tRNA hydrolase ArfB n=1 Tax=Croceitalea vernalis TaxID=3075599 RepID=A0ABU3BE43_9FLAO|nr:MULTISPECIES: alternative ribosome rescue aminoacyl-tRNA hydrolase ArfB [unclassified Croceitalea]MDT0538613.1 alternative ribosome rescue aminoacyl-tRNA hydrolase ArfB [Croceitalea sp. P059]MDT0620398.1 alternative ribosome rescue aminoacyl-tRNA hydrolase ArfB [Croceitalea sp. P007]